MSKLFEFFRTNFDHEEQVYAQEYGCAMSAIPGLIYYCETCAIYEKFKEDIWSLINGHGGPQGLLVEDDYRHPDCFENAMVWRAFELFSVLESQRSKPRRAKHG